MTAPTSGPGLEAAPPLPALAVVVIGRNEGERLRRCLQSVAPAGTPVVYVDSGSSDGSLDVARSLGAHVVSLDLDRPFTAARARNVGFARLRVVAPAATLVQFVDGDCEVVAGWLATAVAFLDVQPKVGVVCGRRRERFPERSIYNRLCDDEWNTPVGAALACGGDAMMRVVAVEAARGFRADLIAGEEPELCVRLRGLGWSIWRIDAEMTLHDAAMTRFGQWWQRSRRAGHAFAEGSALHGAPPERHWVRETRSARVWAVAIPLAVLAGVAVFGPLALLMLLVYPFQVARLTWRSRGRPLHRFTRAAFLVLGKFPEALGQWSYLRLRASGGRAALIEYK